MRVAIVAGPFVPVPPTKYGGIEQVIHNEIKGLKEVGHEPILLAAGDSREDCELIATTEKSIHFPEHVSDRAEHERLVKSIDKATTRKLKELLPSIDVIHSHGFDLSRFHHFPNVTTLHNRVLFEELNYFIKRRQLNYVSISDSQQAVLPELNYVGTVYDGEDPKEFPIVTNPENYICFLGRFDRDKSPHLAIQLAISLGIKIKLAGKIDHDSEGYFEEEVAKYFNHPLVEYLGELDFPAKVQLLSRAMCNLHPTNFREPFGLTVLEAAYCGTPTMAVARGSMPELIEPGRTGLLVEDFLEGRSLLEDCYKMDREYIAMRSRQLFNYRTMAEQYVEIFHRVIAATPVKPKAPNIIQRVLGQFSNHHNAPKRPLSPPASSRKLTSV